MPTQDKDPIYDFERKVEKMELTVYGNGIEGLTSRVKRLESDLKEITVYLDGWKNVTNYDDYRHMRQLVEDLTKKVYLTGAGLAILMSLLKIAPPDILQHIFK